MSAPKLDIVCVAFPSWNGNYVKSTIQLMKELALNHNVLYVDYAYTFKDVLSAAIKKNTAPVKRIIGAQKRLYKVELADGKYIHVLSIPPVLPVNFISNAALFNTLSSVNASIVAPSIRRAMAALHMTNPVVVNAFAPVIGYNLLGKLHEKATLYYCYDNIKAAVWAGKHGDSFEKKFIQAADASVYSSAQLQREKHVGSKPSYVVNNGVDTKLFNNYTMTGNSTQKHIVYVGSVDNRLDYILLDEVFNARPGWKFHFIGRIDDASKALLAAYANVQVYGAVDIAQLPVLMQDMDAGIIPFVKNDFTRNIYPMKVNEYLAMGLPVVMTSFAALPDLAAVTSIADTVAAFTAALDKAVVIDTTAIAARKAFAKNNGWEYKATELEHIIRRYAV